MKTQNSSSKRKTSIHYGIIPVSDILQAWSEAVCPWPEGSDQAAEWLYREDGYDCVQRANNPRILIKKSPYYTHAEFHEKYARVCNLLCSTDTDGPKAYCFGPDWFGVDDPQAWEVEDYPCYYPVYRVSDGKCIYEPHPIEDQEHLV